MFVLLLQYVKSMEEVDRQLSNHIMYLEDYYSSGHFICSGRKEPRTGGVILCNASCREEVDFIISEDPFHQQGIAMYEVIEFTPVKYAKAFKTFANEDIWEE